MADQAPKCQHCHGEMTLLDDTPTAWSFGCKRCLDSIKQPFVRVITKPKGRELARQQAIMDRMRKAHNIQRHLKRIVYFS